MYQYQVRASVGVWLFVLFLASSVAIAVGAALGENAGWTSFFATLIIPATLLIKSTVQIAVTETELRVDRAALPLEFVGAVTALDKDAARRQRGPELDPASHLVLRGWIPTAVKVENTDANDPVPYWYISTDDPQGLKVALDKARG